MQADIKAVIDAIDAVEALPATPGRLEASRKLHTALSALSSTPEDWAIPDNIIDMDRRQMRDAFDCKVDRLRRVMRQSRHMPFEDLLDFAADWIERRLDGSNVVKFGK